MKRAFRYQDEKSDKFWWVDYSGFDFMVNSGKYGTIGKFQMKEWDSEEECRINAEKVITEKIKKGYIEQKDFDFMDHYYFDDEEIGLHPKTTHPHFVSHFSEEFYYDCGDEEAPFGSDEGSDTLGFLQEFIRSVKKELFFPDIPKQIIENDWGLSYLPVVDKELTNLKEELEKEEMNIHQTDLVIYGVALGQIKITGFIDSSLKEQAICSLKRLNETGKILGWGDGTGSEIIGQVIKDLESFPYVK